MSLKLEAKAKEIEELRNEASKLYDEIGDADPTKEQVTKVKDLNKTIEEKEHEYLDLEAVEVGKEANQKRLEDLRKPNRRSQDFTESDARSGGARASKSLGQQFVENEKFKAWVNENKVGDDNIRKAQFNSTPAVEVKLLIGSSDTSAGAFVRREYDADVALPMRLLNIRDIISVSGTESDLIEYVRQVSRTNNAAVVAEATATAGSSGTKPESDLVFELVQAPVKTIPTWIPASRRALADAKQLRGLVDDELRYMVAEKLEEQIIAGDGVGENFLGIENTAGMLTQAYDASLLKTTRKARTKLRVDGKAVANAWLMNPLDWEAFDLLTDGEQRYFFGGPSVLGNPRLWGVPVVENEFKTQGDTILGDFRVVKVWDREQAQIYASDSHADFFIRNLIALLAELRAAMGVKRPKALIEVDLTA